MKKLMKINYKNQMKKYLNYKKRKMNKIKFMVKNKRNLSMREIKLKLNVIKKEPYLLNQKET